MVKKHFYSPTMHGNLLAFIVLERKALYVFLSLRAGDLFYM